MVMVMVMVNGTDGDINGRVGGVKVRAVASDHCCYRIMHIGAYDSAAYWHTQFSIFINMMLHIGIHTVAYWLIYAPLAFGANMLLWPA